MTVGSGRAFAREVGAEAFLEVAGARLVVVVDG